MSCVASSLLDQIERDALDEHASVAMALRRCVALGGRNGSEALRDWATRELDGYDSAADLPDYRTVPAVIQLDGLFGHVQVTGQAVAPSSLPDFTHDTIKEKVPLRGGIAQIEEMAKRSEIKLSLPGGADLARYMNAQNDNPYQHIDRMYWSLSPLAAQGVVDRVRTDLVKLVAEIRAATPAGHAVPSEEATNQAMNFLITGKRNKVQIHAANAAGPHSNAAVTHTQSSEPETGFWTASRKVGGVIVGLATIAGAVFAAIQVL
jgi:hypothetical protein